jgi:IS605 OrfB family transposase
MIRCSKHIISSANQGKIDKIDQLFIDYKHDLEIYINYIVDGTLPLKTMMSSSLLPSERIKHSRYKQLIYKQASEIIRSQLDKSKKRRFATYKKVYSYFKNQNRQAKFTSKKFSELNLKDIKSSHFFKIPTIKNLSINLDERFFNIISGNYFNNFINIKLPFFNEKGTRAIQINIPINHHKHSNKFKKDGFVLRKNIQLKKVGDSYFVNLIWEKEVKLKEKGKSIGIDIGYKKLIASSENQLIGENLKELYSKITKKKKYSKKYYKLLTQRDNLINKACNELNLDDVGLVVIEDLKNVKKDKSFKKQKEKGNNKIQKKQQTDYNNKSQYWSYRQVIEKITRMCEVNGVEMMKVSPSYTSQTCSECGHVDENSRNKEIFSCTSCEKVLDADYNASINIRNRGEHAKERGYSPSNQELHYFS